MNTAQRPPVSASSQSAQAGSQAPSKAMVLGATGNVGGRIVQLLIESPSFEQVVLVTRRKTGAFVDTKVTEVVVNTHELEHDLAQHVQQVDIALAVPTGNDFRQLEYARDCRPAHAAGALGHACQVPFGTQK